MARRLVKIASELNVGLSTIVEHLHQQGFEIDNKPTAKVSDEMYNELLKEFHKSIEVKEKADSIVIGNPKREAPPIVVPPRPVVVEKKHVPAPAAKIEEPSKEEAPKVEITKEEAPKADKKVEESPEKGSEAPKISKADMPQVKVVGKIELPPKRKKTTKVKEAVKPEKPIQEAKKEKEEKPKAQEAPVDKEVKQKPAVAAESEVIRADAPELRGLKILGKIDKDKLKKPEKKKKEVTQSSSSSADVARRKRKRTTRAKVQTTDSSRRPVRGKSRTTKGGREEVKEVSQKEIEEKIKATMARITGGGGKKKRQKIRRDNRADKREKQELIEMEKDTSVVELTEFVTVSELASLLDVLATEVIMSCMNMGVIVSINQRLDAEIIELLAEEFEKEIKFVSAEETIVEEEVADDPKDLKPRAPIVTVMGHVDHGKTSLLDYIREATVADGEAGGITQHIGAYEVFLGEDKKKITFLDTPGHEAFTAMRARGAKVTDVAVIIISADDRIMPQTKEAISHAQAAGVPMIFAINKIDKAGADPERIKQELASMNLLVEDWGGTYQSQDISAKTGKNIDELLIKINLEAELLELKANPDRGGLGTVIEASLDKGRGYVTKMLVQNGSLKIGDTIVAGEFVGRVKAMFNDRNKKVKIAGPATPILLLGLNGAPQAGERFKVYDSESEAKEIATRRGQIAREQSNRASKRISLDEIGRRLALGSFKELNLIVKGDVDGSVEALSDSLIKLSQDTVQVNVIHKAVGQIIESDILLASASDAIIVGFQVRPSMGARKLAEKEGVEVKMYSIIYEAIDEIKAAIEGMLDTIKEEKIICQVEIRQVYKISKVGTIAGCFVHEGKITRNTKIRLIRDGIVTYPIKEGQIGELASLKRFKEDVREVKAGMECGMNIKNFNDIKVGDMIEGYEIEETKQTIE